MAIEPKTLKGFRDFLPSEMRKRNYVLNVLKKTFESYGFEPLETPVLEYEEILTGKYGEEGDKLMYRFKDNGDRDVAMRYDQTVPLARVMAQYQNDLPLPFKRYQIQNVYRADNTQKGRFREFLQVDVDTVGSSSPLSDSEIIELVYKCFKALQLKIKITINDRKLLKNLETGQIVALDKLDKFGEEKVLEELQKTGLTLDKAKKILADTKTIQASNELSNIKELFEKNNDGSLIFDPTLARGLEYYTGLVFEVNSDTYSAGSLGGGGRYDNLIGMFTNQTIPAVGFSFGFDRIMEAMDELNLFPNELGGADLLVTNTSEKSPKFADELRSKGFRVELYVDEKDLDKQLRYADKKLIPYVLIVGEKLEIKNMKTGEQKEITLENLPNEIKPV